MFLVLTEMSTFTSIIKLFLLLVLFLYYFMEHIYLQNGMQNPVM